MANDTLLALLADELPIRPVDYRLASSEAGLVIIDEVNGFCTVGAGNLAPATPDPSIASMIERTSSLARRFAERKAPILALLDTHEPGKPEPPYPPHCERGTGEENLVADLAWLEGEPEATLLRKDCINGFVGGIEPVFQGGTHGTTRNRVVDWIVANRLGAIIVAGICTDICIMDFVLTMLSARNHGLTPTLKDVVVLAPACATYDLPRAAVERMGLPVTAIHPQAATHHLGLYFMASRGAVLAQDLVGA